MSPLPVDPGIRSDFQIIGELSGETLFPDCCEGRIISEIDQATGVFLDIEELLVRALCNGQMKRISFTSGIIAPRNEEAQARACVDVVVAAMLRAGP